MSRSAPYQSASNLVILVDNQPLIRTLIAELLRDAEFAVIESENACEALRVLDLLSPSIDVLFTDLHMPGEMNGLGLIRHVHKTWPWISLLLGSGELQPAEIDMPPVTRFLAKPYVPARMIAQVRELAVARYANPASSPAHVMH